MRDGVEAESRREIATTGRGGIKSVRRGAEGARGVPALPVRLIQSVEPFRVPKRSDGMVTNPTRGFFVTLVTTGFARKC